MLRWFSLPVSFYPVLHLQPHSSMKKCISDEFFWRNARVDSIVQMYIWSVEKWMTRQWESVYRFDWHSSFSSLSLRMSGDGLGVYGLSFVYQGFFVFEQKFWHLWSLLIMIMNMSPASCKGHLQIVFAGIWFFLSFSSCFAAQHTLVRLTCYAPLLLLFSVFFLPF